MRLTKLSFIIFFVFICVATFSNVYSQESSTVAKEQPKNLEVMGENDRLPFMQTEEAVKYEEPSSGGLLFKTFGSMFVIVGLLFCGAWAIKKFGLFGVAVNSSNEHSELRIRSSVTVATGQTISAIQFGDRVLLVGSTAQSFTLLADEIGEPDFSIPPQAKSVSELLASEPRGFGDILENAQDRVIQWAGSRRNV